MVKKLSALEQAALRRDADAVAEIVDLTMHANEVPVPTQVAGLIVWLATMACNNADNDEQLADRIKTITDGIRDTATAAWKDPDYWKDRNEQRVEERQQAEAARKGMN